MMIRPDREALKRAGCRDGRKVREWRFDSYHNEEGRRPTDAYDTCEKSEDKKDRRPMVRVGGRNGKGGFREGGPVRECCDGARCLEEPDPWACHVCISSAVWGNCMVLVGQHTLPLPH